MEGVRVSVTQDRMVNDLLYLVEAAVIQELRDVSAELSKGLRLVLVNLFLQLSDLVTLQIEFFLVIVG